MFKTVLIWILKRPQFLYWTSRLLKCVPETSDFTKWRSIRGLNVSLRLFLRLFSSPLPCAHPSAVVHVLHIFPVSSSMWWCALCSGQPSLPLYLSFSLSFSDLNAHECESLTSTPKRKVFTEVLLVRIHSIIEMISVDWPCPMEVWIPFSR